MSTPLKAIIDMDLYKYQAACVGEKRSIIVTHKGSGREMEFKNRTEFYGHHNKKSGGWLAERNKGRTSPFTLDEFEIADKVVPEPIQNILHTAKLMVESDLKTCDVTSYKAFLGKGDSFRLGLSTLVKYKDRLQPKPIHLDEVSAYLEKKFKCEIVSDIEADDACVIAAQDKNSFIIGEDKDYWGAPCKFWDRNQRHRGVVDCDKFGKLFLDTNGKVRGEGRLFFYFQVGYGDDTDTYWANSVSNFKWGEKSSYKELVNCTNDDEAITALISIYKKLYPEPKEVIGWRGDNLTVDWRYALEENWTMARMLNSLDQPRKFKLDEKYGTATT